MNQERFLEFIRRDADDWISWDHVQDSLSMTHGEVQSALASLQEMGYRIEMDDALGCRFMGCDDRLIAREISRELETSIIGRKLLVLDKTGSTNDVAWEQARKEIVDGFTVLAEEQTAGRGRMGRSWYAPPRSGILMSVVLRPGIAVQESHLVTVTAAVAVTQAIRDHLGLHARIRWPNDIMIKDKKLSGILVEGRMLGADAIFVVGIGANVNASENDFPGTLREIATSLMIEAGKPLNRMEITGWILKSLDRWYRDLQYGDYGRIARSWRKFSSTMGERVLLLENGREYRGRVLDLSLEDGLIVRLDEGVTRIFHPSTVSLRHSQS